MYIDIYQINIFSETSQRCFNHYACDYALSDPVLIVITLTAVVGSFCLLSGLIILCAVSKTPHDQTSEAILLLGKFSAYSKDEIINFLLQELVSSSTRLLLFPGK